MPMNGLLRQKKPEEVAAGYLKAGVAVEQGRA
jgi:hypothetical protein